VAIRVGPKQKDRNAKTGITTINIGDAKTLVLNCKVGNGGFDMKGIGDSNYEQVFNLTIESIDFEDTTYTAYNEKYGVTIGEVFWDYYENNNRRDTSFGSDSSAHRPKLRPQTRASLYLEALTSVVEKLVAIDNTNIQLILQGIEKHINSRKAQNPTLFQQIYETYNTTMTAIHNAIKKTDPRHVLLLMTENGGTEI
jgi:hypothetical protein